MTSSDEMLKESLSALMDNHASDLELRRILKQLPEDGELGSTWRRYQLASTLIQRKETAYLNLDLSASISAAIALEPSLNSVSAPASAEKTNSSPAPFWVRWGSKSALAASVALAVLIGAQQFSSPSSAPLAVAPASNGASPAAAPVGEADLGAATSIAGNLPATNLSEGSLVQAAPDGFALPVPMARTVSSQADRVQPMQAQSMQVQPVSLNQTDWRNDPEVQAQLNQMLLDHAGRSAAHGSFGLLPYTRVSNGSADVSLNNVAEPAAGKR